MKYLRSIGGWPVGLVLCILALSAMFQGRWNYYNYKNALVFAPAAVVIGLLLMLAVRKERPDDAGERRCGCGSGRKRKNCHGTKRNRA